VAAGRHDDAIEVASWCELDALVNCNPRQHWNKLPSGTEEQLSKQGLPGANLRILSKEQSTNSLQPRKNNPHAWE